MELTDNEEDYLEMRVTELLELGESWDEESARAEALREINQERLEHLRHV